MNNFIKSLNNFWFYKVIYQNIAKNAIKIGNWKLENISRWRAVQEDGGKWAANDLERWERALVCRWQIAMEMTFHRNGKDGKGREGKISDINMRSDGKERRKWRMNSIELCWTQLMDDNGECNMNICHYSVLFFYLQFSKMESFNFITNGDVSCYQIVILQWRQQTEMINIYIIMAMNFLSTTYF